MFAQLKSLFSNDIGIDLGTTNSAMAVLEGGGGALKTGMDAGRKSHAAFGFLDDLSRFAQGDAGRKVEGDRGRRVLPLVIDGQRDV